MKTSFISDTISFSHSTDSESMLKNTPLTNTAQVDRIKKFSYVDSVGNKITTDKNIKKKSQATDMESVGNYINIGYQLVIPLLGGVGVGLLIDSRLGTKPWFTLGLIIGGAALSIYNLFSLVKKENERRRTS